MTNDDRVISKDVEFEVQDRNRLHCIHRAQGLDGDDTRQRASDIFLFLADAWNTLPHWFADTHAVQHDASHKFADIRAAQSARTALESGRWRRR